MTHSQCKKYYIGNTIFKIYKNIGPAYLQTIFSMYTDVQRHTGTRQVAASSKFIFPIAYKNYMYAKIFSSYIYKNVEFVFSFPEISHVTKSC